MLNPLDAVEWKFYGMMLQKLMFDPVLKVSKICPMCYCLALDCQWVPNFLKTDLNIVMYCIFIVLGHKKSHIQIAYRASPSLQNGHVQASLLLRRP